MPIDSKTREYTWEDVLDLVYKDMDVKGNRFILWFLGSFKPPIKGNEICIRISKYGKDKAS